MSEPRISSSGTVLRPDEVETVLLPKPCRRLDARYFGLTNVGKTRSVNEDQFLIAVLLKALNVKFTSLPQAQIQHSSDRSYLFVVADGMGGHAGGRQASALAIDSVESFVLNTFQWFAKCEGQDQDAVLADFQRALGQANARVLAEAKERPELRGMGTTLTLAYSLNDELFVAHAGDSRCYLGRHDKLHQLTHDHTLAEELVRRGGMAADEAARHQWRHVVTNAVGGNSPRIKVEIHKVHLEDADRMLLCSDGLTGMVPEEEINSILQTASDPEQCCRRLVAQANAAGGKDNITVVVAYFHAASD